LKEKQVLKLQFKKLILICHLLLLSQTYCFANDYNIDFIGSNVIITSNNLDKPIVVNVDHLLLKNGEFDVNLVVQEVMDNYKREKKDATKSRDNNL
jgi:hypothetical protein